ncbi:hypothetical protein BJ912DRAFT_1001038 [Pholiota molesta]|nr:hypothetical protein BJ912DRAFT_1001038 [Pholiota molesta]
MVNCNVHIYFIVCPVLPCPPSPMAVPSNMEHWVSIFAQCMNCFLFLSYCWILYCYLHVNLADWSRR